MIGHGVSSEKAQVYLACLFALFVVCAATIADAAPPTMTPTFPTCIKKDGNALVSLALKPETGWSSVRVYFRRSGVTDSYYLEMRSDGKGNYWAVLPRPEQGTDAADLQFGVRDAEGVETRSTLQKVDVKSDCKQELTPEQERFAKNLVVGETVGTQAGQVVYGWQCVGVVSRINVNGQLRPDSVCRAVVCCAAIERERKLIPILLAGGGIVGGGIIIRNRGHHEASPTHP